MSGFITMQREALNHPVIGTPERFYAWFWLVAHAAWKPTRTRVKGATIILERGELSFSQRFLAESWGWSKSRVDRFIADLRAESMIATRSKIGATAGHIAGQGQAIITICNYDKYQTVKEVVRGNDEHEIGATAGQQRGKEEQGNKGKKELEPKGSCASDDAFTVSDFVESWNEVAGQCGLPRLKKLTAARQRAFRVRQNEYPEIDAWQSAFRCLQANKWMHGDNKTGWRANPDFFLQAGSFTKLVEGAYGQTD